MSESSQSKGIKESLWDPIAGFGVTFRTMFKKVVTEQYPFEKLPTAPRFHGRHQLNRWLLPSASGASLLDAPST